MPVIELRTFIQAPPARVFDLARSIDAHIASTAGTSERAVAGITSGLIENGQTVTWAARHFGVEQRMTVKITAMKRPEFFEDEMVAGPFKSFHHRHDFRAGQSGAGTDMTDIFTFRAPCGLLGRAFESLVLTSYMRRLLLKRAAVLKRLAETDEWKCHLSASKPPFE